MILKSLSSSSKGNIHILENEDTCLLLDCGINFNRISLVLNSRKIDGVLITHEHGDHISGCESLSQNKNTYFYSTKETLDKVKVPEFMKKPVQEFKTFQIGSFKIVPFEVKHDASHPVNYLIKDTISGSQLLYITDTGYIDNLIFKDIDYFLIECNFDEEWYQKEELTRTEEIKSKRLLSMNGHLSIQKTIRVLNNSVNHNTKKIILCHISSGFKDYLEFQNKIQELFPAQQVKALQQGIFLDRTIELFEKKEVDIFE